MLSLGHAGDVIEELPKGAHSKKRRAPAIGEDDVARKVDGSQREIVHPVSGRGDPRQYTRGEPANLSDVRRDKKGNRQVREAERAAAAASAAAAEAEVLLPSRGGFMEAEGPMERTWAVSQRAIKAAVDVGVARRAAEFTLDGGGYKVAYSRAGRHLALGGRGGHIAVIDWLRMAPAVEFNAGETVHDITFLHDHSLIAAAQAKAVHIYDATGAEVHVLRGHAEPRALEFLPYHFLLASIGTAGWLKYQDVSTGELVAEHRSRLGSCGVLRANPWNAVIAAGHADGAVTMWTPNMSTPVARLAAHRASVTALAFDAGGRYMVSAGGDARLKVWDIRRWAEVHDYFTPVPARALDVSQRGLVGVGFGSHVQIWGADFALEGASGRVTDALPKRAPEDASAETGLAARASAAAAAGPNIRKASSPYMRHELPGRTISSFRFRPWDDLAAVGHSGGFCSIIIPGAGEANYDSREADPFATKKGRAEAEVRALLDKVPSSSIALDPAAVGALDPAPRVREAEVRAATIAAARASAAAKADAKGKKRRGIRKMLKRAANIVTEERLVLQEKLRSQQEDRRVAEEERAGGKAASAEPEIGGSALSRFYPKKQKF
jgi:U3 small nucleolar RNA-associated protein 7